MITEQSLQGEWRMVADVSLGGIATAHLIHHPYRGSSYGSRLLGQRFQFSLSEDELQGFDWESFLVRIVHGLANR